MIKLKTLLRYDTTYTIILFLVLIYAYIFINYYEIKSKYNVNETVVDGYVVERKDKYIIIDALEKVIIYNVDDVKYGDHVILEGTFSSITESRNFNTFDYKTYLKKDHISWSFSVNKYKIIENKNLFLKIKNNIYNYIESYEASGYIKALIFGNTNDIDKEIYKYADILHVFSLSGLHINLFIYFLFNIIKKQIKRTVPIYIILSIILTTYFYLSNFSVATLRSILFFILNAINKTFNLNIKTYNIIILILVIIILTNPYLLLTSGLYYSFIVTYFLSKYSVIFKKYKQFYTKTIVISIIIFLITAPLNIYNNYYLNITSILLNIIITPIIAFVMYPLSFITLLLPNSNILLYLFSLVESIVNFVSSNNFILVFAKPDILIVFLYYFLITQLFITRKIKYLMILTIFLLIHYNIRYFYNNEIHMIDVSNGDSILVINDSINTLYDTGYNSNNTVSYLRSFGIKKIDYLILTHGDADHANGAINIINNYNVGIVIFNNNELNMLEKDIIILLKKKKINYTYSKNISINNTKFINNNVSDENNSSIVSLVSINNYKVLLTGDIGAKVEEELINNYNLFDIDILKVSHHGSSTSTSSKFIDVINPKISLISSGVNNRYNHPSKDVLKKLKNSYIINTQNSGSVRLILDNKIKIYTKF